MLPSAPDSFLILSAPAPCPHPIALSLVSMPPKDPCTVTPKTVKAKTVSNISKSKSHARHQGQSWAKERNDSLPSCIALSATAKILDTSQMNVPICAPVDGAGLLTTLTQSVPHPTSHAPPPSALFLSTTLTWEQYAPPRSWQAMIRMNCT